MEAKHGAITLDLSAAGRSGGRGETKKRQGRQGDRKTDERGKGGGTGGAAGGERPPAGALAHVPCCHTKGDTIRVGLKDGGERETEGEGSPPFFFFYFFFPPLPSVRTAGGGKAGGGKDGMGAMIVAPDGPKWTARSYVKVRGEGRRWGRGQYCDF